MAVAILMMNMHGAVCASDRDMTILRYKDGVPFAVMVDPNSELPWEDIFDKFRVRYPDLTENYVETFKEYLEEELPRYRNLPQKDSLFCIYYGKEKFFPSVEYQIIQTKGNIVKIEKDEYPSYQISPAQDAYINWLGDLSNMGLITGEMFSRKEDVDFISQTYNSLVVAFKSHLRSTSENDIDQDIIENFLNDAKLDEELHSLVESFQEKQNKYLNNAITFYHIEDMVKILEDLVDAENLQNHLLHPKEPISNTKEIATLTLAEGFKWIKHCLYGA